MLALPRYSPDNDSRMGAIFLHGIQVRAPRSITVGFPDDRACLTAAVVAPGSSAHVVETVNSATIENKIPNFIGKPFNCTMMGNCAHRHSSAIISPIDPTLPENITLPSITRVGVLMTPYAIIFGISSTLIISALLPLSSRAFIVFS